MESTLGNALRFYKEQLNVNSIDVYKGICSASTYSNLETGRKEKDFFVVETLFGRLGRDVESLEMVVENDDFEMYKARLVIKSHISKGKANIAKKILSWYEGRISASSEAEHLHKQFVSLSLAKIALKSGNLDEMQTYANKAMLYTGIDINNKLISPVEVEVICAGFFAGIVNKDELMTVYDKIRSYYKNELLVMASINILDGLIYAEKKEDNKLREIYYLDECVKLISDSREFGMLGQVYYNRGVLKYDINPHDKGAWLKDLRIAKSIFNIQDDADNRLKLEAWAKERGIWHFIKQEN
jgi:hypothetical protein